MTRLTGRPAAGPTIRRQPVDPTALAVAMATAYVEIRGGRRPAHQLDRLIDDGVQRRLARLVTRHRARPVASGSVSVRRIVVCRPAPDVVEATVVVRDGPRIGAVAVRLEYRDRWTVTALAAPEDR